MREFGFGTRLYSLKEFGEDEFKRLFSCYIESGIPLIVSIDNFDHGGSTGHAIICIGHGKVKEDKVDSLAESENEGERYSVLYKSNNAIFFDNDDIEKKFVFIDDNRPSYQQLLFKEPVGGYTDPRFKDCEITHFIAPLYSKIYLEAFQAKIFCRRFILKFLPISNGQEIYLRFFLASSRSFKNNLNFNATFNEDVKQQILEKPMPKFIWIGEISNKALIKNKLASGLIVLDATEANTSYLKPLLVSVFNNKLITFDATKNILIEKDLPLQNFSIFTNNLV